MKICNLYICPGTRTDWLLDDINISWCRNRLLWIPSPKPLNNKRRTDILSKMEIIKQAICTLVFEEGGVVGLCGFL